MLATMNDSMVYLFMIFNGKVAMNISDKNVGILVSICLSS